MSVQGNLLFVCMVLAAIMIYLTYTPSDPTYFWTYWCAVFVCLFFGYLLERLFGTALSFEFDPNVENWRRKTDPQS